EAGLAELRGDVRVAGRVHVLDAEVRREGEAVLDVALAPPEQRGVDGEHESACAGSLGTTHERLGGAAVAIDVELEPDRAGGGGGDLLDRGVRQRREREDRARITGTADTGELAVL